MIELAVRADAIALREGVEVGDGDLSIRIRAELGVRPDHETVYLLDRVRPSVDTRRVERAQEGTSAQDWPPGTPVAFVAVGAEPSGEATVHLAHALAASSDQIDLQGCYRRVRVGSEVMWDAELVGDSLGTGQSNHRRFEMQRGREGTSLADHAAGATVTYLGPGES